MEATQDVLTEATEECVLTEAAQECGLTEAVQDMQKEAIQDCVWTSRPDGVCADGRADGDYSRERAIIGYHSPSFPMPGHVAHRLGAF